MRAATDSKLIELQKKFSSLKETNERGEKSREKLSGELKDVKKKVTLNALQAPFSKGTTSVCGYLKIMILKFDIYIKARGLEDDLASQTKESTKYLNALSDVYSKVYS